MEHVIRFRNNNGLCGACGRVFASKDTDAIAEHVAKAQPVYRERPYVFEDWPEERFSQDDEYGSYDYA